MFESVRMAAGGEAEAVVLGVFLGEEPDREASALFADEAVLSARKRREFTGKTDNIVEAFPRDAARVFLVGLGKRDAVNAATLRKVAAGLGRRLAQAKVTSVAVELAGTLAKTNLDLRNCGQCCGESLGLLAWNGHLYRGKGAEAPEQTPLVLHASDPGFAAGMERGLRLAASTNLARDFSQTPPNVATPLWIAEQAEKIAGETGLRARVIQGAELERERLIGLVNVGKGSDNPPCLIRLEYRPENTPADQKPVVLVGKTITYDTGGLSLKINNGMVGMKRDKDGGCAVLGAMHAVATLLKPDFPVIGLLAAAENAVGADAFRPDDVLTYRNGVTVEVTNTDAEGRLVLADALCWACEVEQAACIVDLATLTGGVVTALGSTFAGLFCENDALRARLEQAGVRSGEWVWPLPPASEYREMLKSPVADIINSNPNRKAHPIQGAAFLSWFVAEGTPWAHIDIAGVHVVEADTGPFVKGPTGFGVRLLADLIGAMPLQ